jgi:hypothetical protein
MPTIAQGLEQRNGDVVEIVAMKRERERTLGKHGRPTSRFNDVEVKSYYV